MATGLEVLRDEKRWRVVERTLPPHPWRVDDLRPAGVRLARPRANGPWRVTADGRCQVGHSQDHRPDLPEVKRRVSALAPRGMAVATATTPLAGLSVGHPKRATAPPTAERLLEAFQGLTRPLSRDGRRRRSPLMPLSRVQRRLLALLAFAADR